VKLVEVTARDDIKRYIDLLYLELFGQDAVLADELFDNIYSQLQDRRNGHNAYCIKQNNETVAFFTLAEAYAIFAHGKYGIINELWVDKKYRSTGIGAAVIDEILNISRERGWQRIDVSAPPSTDWDRTFEFYLKNGFTLTGRKLKICL